MNLNQSNKGYIKMKRKFILFLIDLLCFAVSYALSLLLVTGTLFSFEGSLWQPLLYGAVLFAAIMVGRIAFRIYYNMWRYASVGVYLKMICADLSGGLFGLVLTSFLRLSIPLSVGVLCVGGTLLATLLNRLIYRQLSGRSVSLDRSQSINVAIVGAGKIGALLAEELIKNPNSHYSPKCFIDSDTKKVGNYIAGLRIYAENDDTSRLLKELGIQEVFIAIPPLSGERLKELHDFYSHTGCKIKIYDLPLAEAEKNKGGKHRLREFRIEDLLFRNSLDVNNEESKLFYEGKTVLVTGGGGSIGSELCRQLARCHLKKLIIVDIYENNAYDIQQELTREYGEDLDLCVEIASVRDRSRLDCIFASYRPQIVFHAAAHKHVPLMEHSSCEAIKNNIFGTKNTADMAEKYGVERFILVSTDKAVNPTNVMGASKRMCEMVIQCRTDSATAFMAVRFGNVLGSNGSVIPLFKRQIEEGGPITLTDKRIIRYFMTIPEASQLVMQAGAMAKRGELFVLDMGCPVKILELAENMIRLSGYEPYSDIDIVEIGLRPGEKLYEELLIRTEKMTKTANKMIFIEHDTPLSREAVDEKLALLQRAVEEHRDELAAEAIRIAMKQAVPTFRDPDEINAEIRSEEDAFQAVEQ